MENRVCADLMVEARVCAELSGWGDGEDQGMCG